MSKHEAQQGAKAPAIAPPAPDQGAAVAAARPKVKKLLAEYQANPTGDAATIVEALVLSQMAGESEREAEVLHSQRDRDLSQALQSHAGRTATRLTRQNGRLKRDLAKRKNAEAGVRKYLEEVGAAVVQGKEPTAQEIIEKISAAIGMGDVVIPRVEKKAPPDFSRVPS